MLDIKGFKVTQLIKEDTAKKIADDLASIPEELFCSRFHGMKTLGAASYLDIKNERSTKYYSSSGKDIEYYLEMAAKTNPILLKLFEHIYTRLCKFFEEELHIKCRLHSKAALPGFHIYDNINIFKEQSNHIPHFDGQYEDLLSLFGSEKQLNEVCRSHLNKTLSYTLPISLPSNTGGLRVWDFNYLDTLNKDKVEVKKKLMGTSPRTIKYKIGELVYHSGNNLHQIKSWTYEEGEASTKRITLQGHGFVNNDQLYLYW
tara:strand:+ start:1634 stop:2410 length:777 start_codon:yes stop_codon:yes gene_type:complete